MITAYGFDSLGLHRLEAGCYEDNLASLRIFLKAGYTVEGFMREHVTLNGRRMGCFWLGKLHNEHA
ncbi:GNAT family protein [Halopseudomonas pachastrellae]|nr:GNAT family protein [Halopseudomonas pachastrellae]